MAFIKFIARQFWTQRAWMVLLVCMVGVAGDQLTKYWVLEKFQSQGADPLPLTPFLDITLVYNAGISYGLLQQETLLGQRLLFLGSLLLIVLLWMISLRVSTGRNCFALSLILAGALGNSIDRFRFGAVVDFIHIHFGNFSWYVFNLADCLISIGALLLFLTLIRPPTDSAQADSFQRG